MDKNTDPLYCARCGMYPQEHLGESDYKERKQISDTFYAATGYYSWPSGCYSLLPSYA